MRSDCLDYLAAASARVDPQNNSDRAPESYLRHALEDVQSGSPRTVRQVLAHQRQRWRRRIKVGAKPGQFLLNRCVDPVVAAAVAVTVDAGQTHLVFTSVVIGTPVSRIAQHGGFERFPDLRKANSLAMRQQFPFDCAQARRPPRGRRMSATVPPSRSRSDLPPSAAEPLAAGSRWSGPRKPEQDVSAKRTRVPRLSAGRNRKSRSRRTPLRAARPCRSLFPTRQTHSARRRPRERFPRCDRTWSAGDSCGRRSCNRFAAGSGNLGADHVKRRRRARRQFCERTLRLRGRESRLVARWCARRGRLSRHRRTPCWRRDESCCIRRARRREPVRKLFAGPLPRAAPARGTGPDGHRPATRVRGEVRRVAPRSERTRRTEPEFVRCSRRIDSPGSKWTRRAERIHPRWPAEWLPR